MCAINQAHASDTLNIDVSADGSRGLILQEALTKVKQKRSNGYNGTICLQLHKGIYYFSNVLTIDGPFYNDLIIRPFKNDTVSFSGGVYIDNNQVKSVQKYGQDLYQLDITNTDIKELADIRSVGFLRPYEASWNELFVNGKPFHLSRWPNKGTVKMGEVLDEGSLPHKFDRSLRGGIFKYNEKQIGEWKQEENIWVSGYFRHGYADDMVPVRNIDRRNKTIETAEPHFWGYGSGAPWNKFFVLNVLEELDDEGEYMLDIKHNQLYFKTDKPIKKVVLSKLDKPFLDLNEVKNVKIENITFEYSRFLAVTMARTENVSISNCVFRNLGSAAITVGLGVEPFDCLVEDSVGVLKRGIIGSLPTHIYAQTEVNRQAGTYNKIVDCQFYNLGSGAISMGGGDRTTLTPGHNLIDNCTIYSTNRIERSYRPAIHLTGVGNQVKNSEIYDLPSMAILMHGNNHLIEGNYIHEVCCEVDDNGAIYYGRNPTELGNIVRKNVFANIGNDYSCCSVYLDDGACGLLVEDNIFIRAGRYAILLGGGSDNIIINNKFIDTHYAIHVDNRLQNWANHVLDKGGLFEKRLNAVNAFESTYLKAYPYIKYYKNTIGAPSRNVFINNTLYQVNTACDNPQLIDVYQE